MNSIKDAKLDSYRQRELIEDYSLLSRQDLWYVTQIEYIRYTVPWIILLFGIIGNTFILLIFSRRMRKCNSNAFCFCALATSDIIALVFMLLRALLKTELLKNLMITCKLVKFFYSFSLQLSSWSLVLLTLDRLAAVTFTFSYSNWSRKYHIIKIFVALVVGLILVNIHLVIFVTSNEAQVIKSNRNSTRRYFCSVDSQKYAFYYKYIYSRWEIYHATIYGWLPFLIILISNVIIILRLSYYRYRDIGASRNRLNSTSSIMPFQLTLMLLTVAFSFLILTCPLSIYMVAFYTSSNESPFKLVYIHVVLRYIAYINNAINFYLYLLLSNEFRREFLTLFKQPKSIEEEQDSTKITTDNSLTTQNQAKLQNLKKLEEYELPNKIKLANFSDEDKLLVSETGTQV